MRTAPGGASGIKRPRCEVCTKLAPSVCGAIPVPGAWRAKKTSSVGAPEASTAARVAGKREAFAASHSPRSCRWWVRAGSGR
jgi:hypothetical protein